MAKFALNQPTTLDIKKNEKKSSMNQFTSIPNINCYESRFILKHCKNTNISSKYQIITLYLT